MNKFNLPEDLKVFGIQVTAFPNGIQEAFDELIKKLPAGHQRTYYGISECTNEGIVYIAAAAESFENEGDKYGYESFVVERGEYLAVTVVDWLKKTHLIKNVFEEMVRDERADTKKPCVEIYKNDHEMLCLVKALNPQEAAK